MDNSNTTILVIDVRKHQHRPGLVPGRYLAGALAACNQPRADGGRIRNLDPQPFHFGKTLGLRNQRNHDRQRRAAHEFCAGGDGQEIFQDGGAVSGAGNAHGHGDSGETPQEVGADRIADAVAAYEKYGGPCIVVDLGTAITFDCISAKGEYVGGVIMPGIGIAAEALFQRTAKLPRVEIREPDRVIGTNTINSIQSGLFYGAVDAMDGMLDRLCAVLGKQTKVIATGGQAPLVAGASKYKPTLDSSLTLDGLRIILLSHIILPRPRRK